MSAPLLALSLAVAVLSPAGPTAAASLPPPAAPVASAPEGGDLVDLAQVAPSIRFDLRHATRGNFLGEAVYPCARCLLRQHAAQALAEAAKSLAPNGLGLLLWDCYRPPAVQRAMWKLLPDARYVANPMRGSVHSRGGAVDVTLVDASGQALEMPTRHDDFTEKAHADAPASPAATENRARLRAAMEAAGFTGVRTEWWHFEAAGSRTWSIEDVALCPESPRR